MKVSIKNNKNNCELTLTCDPNVKKIVVNKFLKTIIFEIKEINLVKNDIGFLIQELYPMINSLNIELPFKDGIIFYIWVSLKRQIFSFDVMYLRKNLNEREIKKVIDKIKLTNVTLYYRRVNEKPVLPFDLKLT